MTEWLSRMDELMEKYPGKYLALIGDEIVSSGDNEFEAYTKAKEKCPDKEVSLVYIPTEEETVTLL
ncbi:MAG: hypothetical protein HXS48_18535 [Theionarchaea archaeon]|nr:MAG: hypothetical protein AYK19_06310 [Theionarchaea archaeon DG-70-1]MBU7028938.1 hypothetical protein [Theionarchaea archaeon]